MHYGVLFLIVTISHCCNGMDLPQRHQQIILLNGTTTAGKSSIAIALQKELEAQSFSVAAFAIDTFLVPKVQWLLATKRLNPFNMFVGNIDLITPADVETIAKESQKELCNAAKDAYAQGKIVIVDAPIYRSDSVAYYRKSLAGLKVAWALVYCPVSTLVERIISRNERSGITEQRSILQALDQFSQMYSNQVMQPIDALSREDLNVICIKAQHQHIIMQDKIPNFLKGIQRAICPFDFDVLQKSMFEKLSLDEIIKTEIGPRIQHDCIVNTALYNPAICAQMIIKECGIS